MLLNFASRFVICPLVVLLGQVIGSVRFASTTQILSVGLLLAALSVVMDLFILPVVGNVTATATDLVAVTLFLWLAGQLAAGAVVTLSGALVVGIMLAATEYATHAWLLALDAQRRRRPLR